MDNLNYKLSISLIVSIKKGLVYLRVVDLINKKKVGIPLTKAEIHFLIDGYVKDKIPDYQMSGLLMAIYFKGLTKEEQVNLTEEILLSGEQIDLSSIDGICVDKHSTGGVGDKTTLVFAPIVAACGLKIAKMSGRSLGHTGGTLDKLEAIPNFSIDISSEDFLKQVNDISISVIGQTANITPADKKLYSLRDVTGTVDSTGLIASSIMSKKLASGAKSILLDVKVGSGAFMKNTEDAKELARAMVNIGNSFGRKTVAMLTNMEEPLGNMVGNTLEVIEAIETMKGKGPKQFETLCYELASQMLLMNKIAKTKDEAKKLIKEKIKSGEVLNKFKEMIIHQGGNPEVINDYTLMPTAKKKITVKAPEAGYVESVDALGIGIAAMLLGSGRENINDEIDLSVGIELEKKTGDYVKANDTLAFVYSNGKNEEQAIKKVLDSYHLVNKEVCVRPLIIDIIK